MRQKLLAVGKRVVLHELVTGSSFIFIGTMVSSFLAFLFNLFIVRNFTPALYGEFAVLISLSILLSIPGQSLTPLIVRFSANYFAKNDITQAALFYKKLTIFLTVTSVIVFLLFLLFIPQLQAFLHLPESNLLFWTDIIIFLMYMSTVNAAFLQGFLHFRFLAFTTALGGVIKFFFGIVFILIGFKVYGALFAITLSFFLPLLLTFLPLKHLFKNFHTKPTFSLKEITFYGLSSSVSMLALSSFTATDVLLVKHFFSSQEAGLYAVLSLIGRIIFYFTAPIATVMFPLVIKRFEEKGNFQNILYVALLLVLTPSVFLTIFYFLFPQIAIYPFLKGEGNSVITPYLGWFGIYLTIFSIMNVLVGFFLSLKRTEISLPILFGAILQAALICVFHKNFSQIISVSTIVSLVLTILLLLYYIRLYGIKKTT